MTSGFPRLTSKQVRSLRDPGCSIEQPLTVFYEMHGTAENGVDYVELDGRLTLPAGSRWARLTIVPLPDDLAEDPETVVVKLAPSPASGPVEPYRVGSPGVTVALILDDGELTVPTARIRNWLHVCLPGDFGSAYRIEVSEDLVNWEALTDMWADETGVHHIEVTPDKFSRRFYRAVPLAPETVESLSVDGFDW